MKYNNQSFLEASLKFHEKRIRLAFKLREFVRKEPKKYKLEYAHIPHNDTCELVLYKKERKSKILPSFWRKVGELSHFIEESFQIDEIDRSLK